MFQEHAMAVSEDIKGMFNQVLLLEDHPLLCFVWHDSR